MHIDTQTHTRTQTNTFCHRSQLLPQGPPSATSDTCGHPSHHSPQSHYRRMHHTLLKAATRARHASSPRRCRHLSFGCFCSSGWCGRMTLESLPPPPPPSSSSPPLLPSSSSATAAGSVRRRSDETWCPWSHQRRVGWWLGGWSHHVWAGHTSGLAG